MLKVIGAGLSPWVRRVLVVLDEKGIEYAHENFFPTGEIPAEFKQKSPLGRIPVLDTEEGPIPDSSAICHYLEARFPETSLLPEDPFERGRSFWFGEFAAEIFRYEGTLFFQQALRGHMMKQTPDEEAVEAARAAIPPLFDYLEGELEGATYVVGERFTLGDVTLASVLLNYLHAGERIDATTYPALRSYLDRVFERPSFARRIEEDLKPLAGFSNAPSPA
ncbi:MAG: glutathione S-transferase family protein [Myxococcota bacterium]